MDVSDTEEESDYDDDQGSPRHHFNFDQQSTSSTYSSKSGRQWNKSPPPQRKIPQVNILRQRSGVGRPADGIQTEKDAFQLLFTEEMISIIVRETNKHARIVVTSWNERNPNKKCNGNILAVKKSVHS